VLNPAQLSMVAGAGTQRLPALPADRDGKQLGGRRFIEAATG
jgi:hypothetical protein